MTTYSRKARAGTQAGDPEMHGKGKEQAGSFCIHCKGKEREGDAGVEEGRRKTKIDASKFNGDERRREGGGG